jgi:hypothetical protein
MVHELRHRHLEAINIVERIHGRGQIAASQRNLDKCGVCGRTKGVRQMRLTS